MFSVSTVANGYGLVLAAGGGRVAYTSAAGIGVVAAPTVAALYLGEFFLAQFQLVLLRFFDCLLGHWKSPCVIRWEQLRMERIW